MHTVLLKAKEILKGLDLRCSAFNDNVNRDNNNKFIKRLFSQIKRC